MSIELVMMGLQQGLLLALVATGVMIPYRLLNFPDLTAEGSYPFAGAITALLLLGGMPVVIATALAAMAAGSVGVVVTLISLRLRVNSLLAGIIISTMMYSVSLRIIGKPNVALFDMTGMFNGISMTGTCFFLLLLAVTVTCLLFAYLQTAAGLAFRAVGYNPRFAVQHAIGVTSMTCLGMFLAHACIGLSASLLVALQAYMDIGMGVGIVVHGLAALMLGEAIVGNDDISRQLVSPIIGALVYQQIQGMVLFMGLSPVDIKLLTGVIVLGIMTLNRGNRYESARV